MFDFEELPEEFVEAAPEPRAPEASPPPSAEDLPSRGFVTRRERVGGVWAEVTGPREGLAPLVAVLLPGNPSPQFGSSHAGAPLMVAVDQALVEAGFAVVRFDYRGVGMNAPGGGGLSDWEPPTHESSQNLTMLVVAWSRKHVGREVALVGYSYGSAMALTSLLGGGAAAYVSLSVGTEYFKFLPAGEQKHAKDDMRRHSKIDVPSLYVVGTADRMTPEAEVRRLLAARRDGGAKAEVALVEGAAHDLKGHEAAAGERCAAWLLASRTEQVPTDMAARAETAEERGPATVRVEVPSLHTQFRPCLFHVEVPLPSTVAELRAILGARIPPGAALLGADGQPLGAAAAVPPVVTASALQGQVTDDQILTKPLAAEAQAKLKAALVGPHVQRELDELETEAGGSAVKYNIMLNQFLADKVYPPILEAFGLPCSPAGLKTLYAGIMAQSQDLASLRRWLELEQLMRNRAQIEFAEKTIAEVIRREAAKQPVLLEGGAEKLLGA